ncbi:hypothetical protein AB0H12_04260 [Actinosynnema sp. NPDC023794]
MTRAHSSVARLETAALPVTIGSVLLAAFSLFAWVGYDVHVLPAVLRGVDFAAVAFSVFMSVSVLAPWAVVSWTTPSYGSPAWVPLERVETRDARHVGWVLESGDHDLSLLEEDSRNAVVLRQDVITKRTFCDKGGDGRPRPADALSLLGWQLVDDVPDIRHGRPDCCAGAASATRVRPAVAPASRGRG